MSGLHPLTEESIMNTSIYLAPCSRVQFGMVWRFTDYCYAEIDNFVECARGAFDPEFEARYIQFLEDFTDRKIKKSTPVDKDVLREFMLDLDNRAQIDYREWHDHEPMIVAGGKRFDTRYRQLAKIHAEWFQR